jgi:HK97 family phage prohead protease
MTITLEERRMREKILDIRETRRMASPLEMRTDGVTGHIILEGYASTFHAYDVHGGPRGGGWVEQFHQRAFDQSLRGSPDVMLLINHTDMPLARTAHGNHPGTMTLRVDDHGLLVRAELDPTDPDVQRLLPKMRRGDMDEMSFAFHVRAQDWSSDYTHRMITEVDLRKGDVSVLNYGMNPNTAAMVSTAVDTLASLSNKELVEVRKMDRGQLVAAMQALSAAVRPGTRAKTPKKYADVENFADPGYLDNEGKPAKEGNGKKRYPLNSAARVRNAAARFAQNKGRYSAAQQSAIMGKIRSAAKRFGVTISDGDSKSAKFWSEGNSGAGARAFSQPYVWQPDVKASTGQDQPYDKGSPSAYDDTLGGRPDVTPGANVAGVAVKSGYDAHDQPYGPKQLYALYLLANDEVCPSGDMCPGEQCPDHGTEQDAMDGVDECVRGDFGGKQAKPFKKGGGRQGDDDQDDDDGDDKRSDSDHTEDEDDIDMPMDPDYEGDHEGSDDDMGDMMDDDEHMEPIDLALAAALEKTIATCYEMAETAGDHDIRTMLARARRQVRDLQHIPGKEIDISRKLEELRSEFGDPDTITVSEGLRAIAKAGFADVMKPRTRAS